MISLEAAEAFPSLLWVLFPQHITLSAEEQEIGVYGSPALLWTQWSVLHTPHPPTPCIYRPFIPNFLCPWLPEVSIPWALIYIVPMVWNILLCLLGTFLFCLSDLTHNKTSPKPTRLIVLCLPHCTQNTLTIIAIMTVTDIWVKLRSSCSYLKCLEPLIFHYRLLHILEFEHIHTCIGDGAQVQTWNSFTLHMDHENNIINFY